VVEAGRRFDAVSLPRNSWDLRHYLWAPRLGLFGLQRIHLLGGVVVLAGAGVGGGSLNYANTLYEPPDAFFEDPQWVGPAWGGDPGWRALLAPWYEVAKAMLGAADNPRLTPADKAMYEVASAMGASSSFEVARVGVFFGRPGDPPGTLRPDPYFAGAGPARRSCRHCGECMTGCRWGAKNTLATNYLYLAERAGAVVMPMTTVVSLDPLDGAGAGGGLQGPGAGGGFQGTGAGGWAVGTLPTARLWAARAPRPQVLRAEQVVLAAGTYGTQRLLHTMALEGRLPHLSRRLGYLTRTNCESLVGATVPNGRPRPDFSEGVAITSSFWPATRTSVEPVRYGHGSNLMGLLGTLLPASEPLRGARGAGGPYGGEPARGTCSGEGSAGGPYGEEHAGRAYGGETAGGRPAREGSSSGEGRGSGFVGSLRALGRAVVGDPLGFLSFFDLRHWSERTVIALVMQALDGSLTIEAKRGPLGGVRLVKAAGEEGLPPTWVPVAHEVARRLAEVIGGRPARTWAEAFGLPMTAHFLGGCAIGASPAEGVVDPWQRVYGYEGLHIVDGSAVPANPGVNPALTITALAERAFSHWPNRGEPDPRPPVGEGAGEALRRVPVVEPKWPASR
jgi:cholesterol oxidase